MVRRKRFTLMPAIAIAALGLMVALPSLSSMRLEAATAQRYAIVQVQPGDTLWGIAASHYPGSSIEQSISNIEAANRLNGANIRPGETLTLPAP